MRMRKVLISFTIALLAFATYIYSTVWRDPTIPAHNPGEARECDAQPGSPIDLASEPKDWLQYGAYLRWTDSDGCLVRIDVISHHHGAAHCGWQTIGRPIGSSIAAGASSANRYVWDSRGVLPDGPIGSEIQLSDMPVTADYSGYQRDGTELWLDESDAGPVSSDRRYGRGV